MTSGGSMRPTGATGATRRTTEASSPVPSGTERTAEIPVVSAGGRAGGGTGVRQPVELADGTVWYPGVSRRMPAPFPLRLGVWLLFLVLVLGLAGLAVQRYHPDWISFLRRTGPAAARGHHAGSGNPATATAGHHGATGAAGRLRVRSTTGSATTYVVPASSFRIVLRFPHPDWVRVTSPVGSSHDLVSQTLPASASPKTLRVHGSASVFLGAATTSIAIVSGGHRLGVVHSPQVGRNYDFVPHR